jgi:hypothetical protein
MESLNGQRLDEMNSTGRVDLDKSSTPIVMCGTLMKRQFSVQLVSIMDEEFLEWVKLAKVLPVWDKQAGWYVTYRPPTTLLFIPSSLIY